MRNASEWKKHVHHKGAHAPPAPERHHAAVADRAAAGDDRRDAQSHTGAQYEGGVLHRRTREQREAAELADDTVDDAAAAEKEVFCKGRGKSSKYNCQKEVAKINFDLKKEWTKCATVQG